MDSAMDERTDKERSRSVDPSFELVSSHHGLHRNGERKTRNNAISYPPTSYDSQQRHKNDNDEGDNDDDDGE